MALESPTAAEENRSAAKATGKISIAVMLSRVLGLIRDVFMLHLYGTSILAECFNLAFRIPNLLRDLFAEGALSQAFVTVFSKKIKEKGDESAWLLANRVLSLFVVAMSLVTLLGIVITPWIVDLMLISANKAYGPEQRELIIHLTRVMFPFILIISLSALVMGMLNAKNIFGIPALASCFFNLGCILAGGLAGYLIDPSWGVKSLLGISIGVLVGGAGQLFVQLPALHKAGFRFHWDPRWKDRGVIKILQLMGPAMVAASAVQVNVMVNSMFATSTETGSVTALSYAFRLMQLPIGMFGVAVATITLPALSRAAVGQIGREYSRLLSRGMNMVAILLLPCCVGLSMLAIPLVSVIFQKSPEAESTRMIAGALECYAYGLLFYSWIKIVQPAFYAIDKRWIPMMVSFISMGLNFLLNWYFVTRLGWGYRSLAVTTSVLAVVNFGLLYAFLRKMTGGLDTKSVLNTLWRCLIAAFVMGELCWLANTYVLGNLASHGLITRWVMVLAVVGGVAMAYFYLCHVLGVREARDCLGMILRKVPGLKRFAPKAGK
jgi:putative peptidoglycan lipid II flippase